MGEMGERVNVVNSAQLGLKSTSGLVARALESTF
jgi:hypothetical protein